MRNLLQKRLARIIPVEAIGTLTIATLRQMAEEEGGGAPIAPAAQSEEPGQEQPAEERKEGGLLFSSFHPDSLTPPLHLYYHCPASVNGVRCTVMRITVEHGRDCLPKALAQMGHHACCAEPVPSDSSSDGNASELAERTQKVTEVKQQLEKICPVPVEQKVAAAKKEGYEAGSPPRTVSGAWVPQTPDIASRAASAAITTAVSAELAAQDRPRTPSPPPKPWEAPRSPPKTHETIPEKPAAAPVAAAKPPVAAQQPPKQAPEPAPQPKAAPAPAPAAAKPVQAAPAQPRAAAPEAQKKDGSKLNNWLLYAFLGFMYIGALPYHLPSLQPSPQCTFCNQAITSHLTSPLAHVRVPSATARCAIWGETHH